jgi:hypothetical protein
MNVLRLSSFVAERHLGAEAIEKEHDVKLLQWLNDQEDAYPLVIYECDYTLTSWTRRCLHQADALLVVCNGNDDPDYGLVSGSISHENHAYSLNNKSKFYRKVRVRIVN